MDEDLKRLYDIVEACRNDDNPGWTCFLEVLPNKMSRTKIPRVADGNPDTTPMTSKEIIEIIKNLHRSQDE